MLGGPCRRCGRELELGATGAHGYSRDFRPYFPEDVPSVAER